MFSLLTKAVPALEALSKEAPPASARSTSIATIPICLVQSLFVILGTLNKGIGGQSLLYTDTLSIGYAIGIMIALTAGTMFIMWLGEQITEHGIGNGISIIIMAGIISTVPTALLNFFEQSTLEADQKWQIMLAYIASWIGVVVSIVFITKGQRRIPIQQAKQMRGRKAVGGQRHYLPFKVNQAGVMPIIFAGALMMVPGILIEVPVIGRYFESFRSNYSFWYIVVLCSMIMFFSFFWVNMMFQPKEIADNLRDHGSFIPGIRPGKPTAEYLSFIMSRVTLAGASFLCLVAVIPNLITRQIGITNPIFAYFLGGTSILIVVEVALDLVEQLNAHLIMNNYEGFMKGDQQRMAGWGRRRS
ncbi:MAG: preprotein translocase subunit SecY [Planctomycetota bacterium]